MQPTTPLVWTRAVALCLILAPLLQVFEAGLSPLTGDTAGQLEAIAAHESAFTISVLLGLAATVLYIPAFVGLAHRVADRSPVLALIAALLSTCAMIGFAGVRAIQAVQLGFVQLDFDRATAAAFLDSGNAIMATILVLFLGGTLLGLVTLAIVVFRSGYFSKAPVVLMLVFAVFDLFGVPLGELVDARLAPIVAHVVFLVALSWLGLELWQQTRPGVAPSSATDPVTSQPPTPAAP